MHGQHKLADVQEVLRRERDGRSLVGLFGGHPAEGAPAPVAAANGATP